MSGVPRFIRIPLALTATLSCAWCVVAAFENGPPPGHTGAPGQPDCTICHFGNDANAEGGSVKLDGVPATYLDGQQYAISVTLEHNVLPIGGFQLAIQDIAGNPAGKLAANPGDEEIMSIGGNSDIHHIKPRRRRDDDSGIRWTVVWTAPDGNRELIISVAAVAANDDASALGDSVYTTAARMNSSSAEWTKN